MSKIVVDLNESENIEALETTDALEFASLETSGEQSGFAKVARVSGILLVAFLIVGGVGGYFYWRHLKKSPQYSLALLIDAARRDDRKAIDELVDSDAIIDDFVPQITGEAVELYGRNLPPAAIAKIEQVAAPLLPAVKIRARAEIPALIRDKMEQLKNVPFLAIALGAGRYVDIKQDKDEAFLSGKLKEQQGFNLTMKRGASGDKWRVVAVKDEELAKQVAEKIGQQIISAANKGGIERAGEQLGVQNLGDVIKQLDGVFK